MQSGIGLKGGGIAQVVYALLETADEARSQAHPVDFEPSELTGDVGVLRGRGGGVGLVHRDLDFDPTTPRLQVPLELGDPPPAPPVPHGGTPPPAFLRPPRTP